MRRRFARSARHAAPNTLDTVGLLDLLWRTKTNELRVVVATVRNRTPPRRWSINQSVSTNAELPRMRARPLNHLEFYMTLLSAPSMTGQHACETPPFLPCSRWHPSQAPARWSPLGRACHDTNQWASHLTGGVVPDSPWVPWVADRLSFFFGTCWTTGHGMFNSSLSI